MLWHKNKPKSFDISSSVHSENIWWYSDALHQWNQNNVIHELGLQGTVVPDPGSWWWPMYKYHEVEILFVYSS